MTEHLDLSRAVRSWLQTDVHEPTDPVLQHVLSGLDAHPQRRRWWGRVGACNAKSAVTGMAAAAALLVAVVTIVALPAVFPGPADETSAPTVGTSAVVVPPSPSAAASEPPAPSSSIEPSDVPTEAPSATAAVPATATPTKKPKPEPTLDWDTVGYTVGVRSPVALGENARITVRAPVGPTCTVKARYPNGAAASIPSPTRPSPGTWIWTWKVPKSSGTGSATFTTTCTYAGLAKPGNGAFQVIAAPQPTPAPGFSINVNTVNTRSASDTSPMHFTVNVSGPIPQDPDTHMAKFQCYYRILLQSQEFNGWVYDLDFFAPDRQFAFDVDIGAVGESQVGSGDWSVECENTTWSPTQNDTDSGFLDITTG
jgi:hypothetical protein